MKTNYAILFAALAALTTGCIVHTHPRPVVTNPPPQQQPPPQYQPPPPPPPPVRQPMSYQEAVQLGVNFASSRGYNSQLKEAHMTGNNVWKVKLAVYRGDVRGHLHLDYDAYSRALLKSDEKVKDHGKHGHGPHGNKKWDDEDDDDDEHEASAVGQQYNPPPNGNVHSASPVKH